MNCQRCDNFHSNDGARFLVMSPVGGYFSALYVCSYCAAAAIDLNAKHYYFDVRELTINDLEQMK